MIIRLVLVLLVAGESMAVFGQKRLKTVSYKSKNYTLQYNSDGSIQGFSIEPVDGKVTEFSNLHFTYDDNKLVSIKWSSERYDITWTDGKPTHMETYYSNNRLVYFSDMIYNEQCPDAAIAFAIDFLAGHFADPEGADLIVTFYGLAPYLGTLTNELVGNVKATDGEADDTEIDYYDCNYTYVKDSDGYPIEVHIDVKTDHWKSGNTKTYTRKRIIYLGWEGTAGISPQTSFQNEPKAWYDLFGRRVEHPTRGIFLSEGRKYVK